MTDMQAAIGLHQLQKLEAFYRRRKEIVERYNSAFSQFGELEIPSFCRAPAWNTGDVSSGGYFSRCRA